ncbi:MAG: RHS repeat-associated core domain-containing protein, partial [Saprospiraceae bacterium]|nr:RHS repeat-associated core domain-containing protein [Saprospiraceae bacterium]
QVIFDPAANKDNILYTYDVDGNRLTKELQHSSGSITKTVYVRDASGNTMATYQLTGDPSTGQLTQQLQEWSLYGSSRLGVKNTNLSTRTLSLSSSLNIPRNMTEDLDRTASDDEFFESDRGFKAFEQSNHLGNVLAVVSDKKLGVDNNADGKSDTYGAIVLSAQDYFPFGWIQPNRQYSNSNYRYGFNGKEKADETNKGNYDFGARIYDGRLGRWWSVDPLASHYTDLSPYNFVANTPIQAIDPDGRLIIFINGLWGFPNAVGGGGSIDYWTDWWINGWIDNQGNPVLGAKDIIGDQSALYLDGALGGTPMLAINTDMSLRIEAGYAFGRENAANIIGLLETNADGEIIESIKFVTNSMGAAYERGLSRGIREYVEEENLKIMLHNTNINVQIGEIERQEMNSLISVGEANKKIQELEAQRRVPLNVVFDFVTDLEPHQVTTPDPEVPANRHFYMLTTPDRRNIAERMAVDVNPIIGANEIGLDARGERRMRTHHSAGAPVDALRRGLGRGSRINRDISEEDFLNGDF